MAPFNAEAAARFTDGPDNDLWYVRVGDIMHASDEILDPEVTEKLLKEIHDAGQEGPLEDKGNLLWIPNKNEVAVLSNVKKDSNDRYPSTKSVEVTRRYVKPSINVNDFYRSRR